MLNGFLAALRRSRETAEIRAAYDEFLERLDAGQVAAEAVKSGDTMPAFLLPNAEGRLVDSADLLAQGPLVVTFFRGGWCPYCSATLEALEAVLPELSRTGGTLVAMTPETGGRALAMKHERGLHYEVLVDVDLAIAMAFGIVFRTPPLYVELLRKRGIDLAERSCSCRLPFLSGGTASCSAPGSTSISPSALSLPRSLKPWAGRRPSAAFERPRTAEPRRSGSQGPDLSIDGKPANTLEAVRCCRVGHRQVERRPAWRSRDGSDICPG